jgi:hypothetical protein
MALKNNDFSTGVRLAVSVERVAKVAVMSSVEHSEW